MTKEIKVTPPEKPFSWFLALGIGMTFWMFLSPYYYRWQESFENEMMIERAKAEVEADKIRNTCTCNEGEEDAKLGN